VNTTLNGRPALKIIRIIQDDATVQKGMSLHWHPIEQSCYRRFPHSMPRETIRGRCIGAWLDLQWSPQRGLGPKKHYIVRQR
jgi:hypothetical protein